MTIQGDIDQENRNIIVENKNGKLGQTWDIIYADEMPPEPKKGDLNKDWGLKVDTSFYVISNLPDGRFLDIIGRNMVIKTRNGLKSQEWYFHQPTRTIRSRKNNQSWDIQNAGRSNNMQVYNTNSGWFQLFKWDKESGTFVNVKNNKVLDVAGGRDQEANNVQVWKKNGSKAQSWKLTYTKDAAKIQTKGLNKNFGLDIERPFFIVSKMWMERTVECVGASNLVLKTLRKNNKGQQFFLDDKTQTIVSNQWKDRSITIQSQGRSNNLYMTTTNARWFQLFRWQGD